MRKLKKLSLAVVFGLLFFSNAFASELTNPVDSYDSLYNYNALENKISFVGTTDNIGSSEEKLKQSNELLESELKLQAVTIKQNNSIEKSDNAIKAIEDRSGFKSFLIGNNLGILKFQVMQIEDQISVLEALSKNSINNINKIQIDKQIKYAKEEQKKVEDFILKQEDKFSLFGWFVRML